MGLEKDIKLKAYRLGFDLVGITDSRPVVGGYQRLLKNWLKDGFAGEMNYMHRNFEKRINPAKLLQNAQSVICLGLSYKPEKFNNSNFAGGEYAGQVAHYACYEDYHKFIKKQLRKLVSFIENKVAESFKFKICVDSAPLAERAIAERAGLGFIGKNHMLINPRLGPQIFLAEILTTLKLKKDKSRYAGKNQTDFSERFTGTKCSECNRCIDACPTGALKPDGRFDAAKCISYLTIEHKGKIPADKTEKIGTRLFGCGLCILACPYWEKAPVRGNHKMKFYPQRMKINLRHILSLSGKDFKTEFADSPIKRAGLETMKRNAKICMKNLE